ncbi:MAG: UTRA domain-containing protein, partial [Erysipelotrichia bacterium]|nr:UTRA domain-containing protein [Erysipelotrichia bacterium]
DLSYIPASIAPTLDRCDFSSKSLYGIIEEEFLIDLDYSKQEIKVENATKDIADYLELEEGTLVVVQEGLVYSTEHEPVEYSISYMKMDRFVYENL